MKGKFYAPASLMQLDETLKNHQSYAAVVVSTTGLDNSEFEDHSPIRVCLKQYEWDEEANFYHEAVAFDKMVQAPQKAIDEAIKNAETGYDVFENGGIDRESYLSGKDVLSPADFKKEFDAVITALQEDNALLIANGVKHTEMYLGKIGCADGIKELEEKGKVLDQVRLTQEYLQKKGISGRATLENLRSAVVPHTTDDSKIIGGDKRIDVINTFVIREGRDEHILDSEWKTHQRESDNAYAASLSEKGKEKYKNADFHEKFGTLIESGAIRPEEILNGNSEFQKLVDMMQDSGNKGFTIIHAASTGLDFKSSSPQKYTGFPIQFSALTVSRNEDGTLDFTQRPIGTSITIAAPSRNVIRAEQKIHDEKRPYDTFKEAGISLENYKAGIGVVSQDEAVKKINEYFKTFPPDDYPIVAIGGTKGTDKSFTQTCISNLANFSMCEASYTDFAQVIKDYAFLVEHDDTYPENVMFDENSMQGKRFGLQDVASAKGYDVHTPIDKCKYTLLMMKALEQQQKEIFRPQEVTINKQPEAIKEAVPEIKVSSEAKELDNESFYESPDAEINESEAFFEEDGSYENVMTDADISGRNAPELDTSEEAQLKRASNEAFYEAAQAVTEGVGGGIQAEPPKQTAAPSHEPDNLTSRLLDMVTAQNQVIASQSTIIAEQNQKLMTVLQEQNELMRTVLKLSMQVQTRQLEAEKSIQQPSKSYDVRDNDSVINYVEELKEQISDLREQLPSSKAKTNLSKANVALSDTQKQVELESKYKNSEHERSAS